MTQPNDTPYEFTVNPKAFNLMQETSQLAFQKEVSELNYDEAARLVGSIFVATVQGSKGKGRVTDRGHVVVDSAEDGKQALEGSIRQMANDLAPQIDDERKIILNVTRNQTLWEAMHQCEPEVVQTFRFSNEPQQYA